MSVYQAELLLPSPPYPCTAVPALLRFACPTNAIQHSLLPVQNCKLSQPTHLSIFVVNTAFLVNTAIFVNSAECCNMRACCADCMPVQDPMARIGRLTFPISMLAFPFYLRSRSPGKTGSHYDPSCDLFVPAEAPLVCSQV